MDKSIVSEEFQFGQSGWLLTSKSVRFFVTRTGGQTAPVTFALPGKPEVSPYFISDWQEKNLNLDSCPVLKALRGDFFCLPFGGNNEPVAGQPYQVHGESAGSDWKFENASRDGEKVTLTLSIQTHAMPGTITKKVTLSDSEENLYIEHEVSGYDTAMPVGHHSIMQMPEPDEKMYLSTGDFDLGMTYPGTFSSPVNQEFQFLAEGEVFTDLAKVPTLFKKPAFYDYTTYPSPIGYTDIWAVFKKKSDTPAWTVLSYPSRKYLWFVLKDAEVLPGTAVWVSNAGRYGAPWNGHCRCIGVEDCCANFACGYKPSIEPNELTKRGWQSAMTFSAAKPTKIRVIQGIARLPEGFTRVESVDFSTPGEVTFRDISGKSTTAKVDINFLKQ